MPFKIGASGSFGPLRGSVSLGAGGLQANAGVNLPGGLGQLGLPLGTPVSNGGTNTSSGGGSAKYQNRTAIEGPGGVVLFPFTPMVSYAASVAYQQYNLTHTNYTVHAYQGTPSPQIQVTGQFTTHTQEDHAATRNAIHLFRSWTKMNYGVNDGLKGTPPPVLKFWSHGKNMFEGVPVVLMDFSAPLENTTDQITHDGTSLPAFVSISATLSPHFNPTKQKRDFSKQAFTSGSLYSQGFI